ncbi:MAG TPA: hypothetical protein VMU19_05450 [Bryobacteraceae bacterium]|nr:hypothetical protein [Bryobacteraceae bacterium]
MTPTWLATLERWKSRYGDGEDARLEGLLAASVRRKLQGAAALIELHETLLFLRAYPRSAAVARLADAALAAFPARLAEFAASGADLDAFEDPEISGIAGTSLCGVFTHEFARRLAARHPRSIEIGWDRYDEIDRLGPLLARLLALFAEDWPVEAHAPFRQWIEAAKPRGAGDLAWLLQCLAALPVPPRDRAALYETLGLPLTWRFDARTSRGALRLPRRRLFLHREPLLRRADVSIARELAGPRLPVRRLARPEARRVLDLILDVSAMRFRELYGFSHPDEAGVYHADAGRGVDIYYFGVPPEWRLPLRAYHGGMFFKNGVPAGYVELLSFFERAEVGFNLYYTFREGESAWLYARTLKLFHQELGVSVFSVDPYQIGHENPEAIDSGAFWFYRKLGFRPVDPEAAALMDREERRMRQTPGHRSSKRTLERLARSYILYEGPASEPGAWDRFRIRNLALRAERNSAPAATPLEKAFALMPGWRSWSPEEKRAAEEIARAKQSGSEARYLRLMQRHARFRAALLAAGS